MAIQNRRGREVDFDPAKMLPGEWAVSLDTKYVRMCFSPGVCLRMATYEAFEADMAQIQAILAEAKSIQSAISRIQSEVNSKAALTIENAKSAEESAEIAHDEAERAKMYAENASAVTGIEIAKQDRAGIIKGGENYIAEDGTLTLTKQTTDTTLSNSYAGGIKLNSIAGASEQDGTPTPENPIDIKNVDFSEIKTEGKNLIPYPYDTASTTINGIEFTDLGDGRIKANGTATSRAYFAIHVRNDGSGHAETVKAGTYILNGCPEGGGSSTYRLLINNTTSTNSKSDFGDGISIDIPTGDKFGFGIQVESGFTVNNLIFEPMLRKADIEDDTWEPYKESVITLSQPIELRRIEVSAEDDYTYEKDGKYYIADTIERVDGGYKNTQRIGVRVYDGVNNKATYYSTTTGADGSTLAQLNLSYNGIKRFDKYVPYMLCNKLRASTKREPNVMFLYPHSTLGVSIPVALFADDGKFTDLESGNAWLQSNPLTTHYILSEPIVTMLSDEEAIALMSLKSFDTVTYISTDSELVPVIDLEYGTSKVGALALENSNLHSVSEILRTEHERQATEHTQRIEELETENEELKEQLEECLTSGDFTVSGDTLILNFL